MRIIVPQAMRIAPKRLRLGDRGTRRAAQLQPTTEQNYVGEHKTQFG